MTAEFDRIARLRQIFGAPPPPALGIGDDAAVLPGDGAVVATVDVSVEGVHFRRDLGDLDDLAARAVEAAMSDVAAMGAVLDARGGLLLAWTLPPTLSDEDFDALARGAQRAAARAGTHIVGGNLSSAPVLTLTTTVLARAGDRTLRRDGARPGDAIAVTGTPGAAALGLRALMRGAHAPCDAWCVDAWRRPHARLDEGRDIARLAHAAIDLSDGLAQDAGHVATASGCALVFDASTLTPAALVDAAMRLGLDAMSLCLYGGEDYELLATGPREAFDARWRVIGSVRSGAGVWLRGGDGAERAVDATRGWDHFRAATSPATGDPGASTA